MAGNGREQVMMRNRTGELVGDPEEVARVAYEFFERRGRAHGYDLEDWLEAERIVQARRRGARASART